MRRTLHLPKRLLTGLMCLVLTAALPGMAMAAQPKTATLGIYFTTDMEGRSSPRDPLTEKAATASYLKVATAMAAERQKYDSTLLFDLGNALPTELLTGIDATGGGTVAAALRAIGYNGFMPSTGEFAYAPTVRDAFFRTLSSSSGAGTPVPVLSANYMDEKNQSPKLTPYQISTVTAGDRSYRVGVLALNPMDTAAQVPSSYLEGTTFTRKNNTSATLAWEWTNYWQKQLRDTEKCDFVVVASSAETVELHQFISSTAGIDLVLGSNLTTTALKNIDGKTVPCAGGSSPDMTKMVVTFTSVGMVTVSPIGALSLSDYENDATLTAQLRTANSRVSEAAARSIGTLTGNWVDGTQYGNVHSKAANLIGRAMVWAAGADVAVVSTATDTLSPASLFAKGATSAAVSTRNCQNLYPNPSSNLCLVELTGAQLKQLLDASAAAYQVAEDRSVTATGTITVLHGANYELYLGNRQTERVRNLIVDGRLVLDTQTVRVAVEFDHLVESLLLPEDYNILWTASTDPLWASAGGSVSAILAAYLRSETAQVGYVLPQAADRWLVYSGSSSTPVTRLEFVSTLYELAGSPRPTTDVAFIDVSGSNAVVWAAENRISSGDGKGNFLPAQSVTKEQAAVMLFNYAKTQDLKFPTTSSASIDLLDYGDIATWARPAVDFCHSTEVLPGEGLQNALFFPREKLSREDTSAAIQRLSSLLNASQP